MALECTLVWAPPEPLEQRARRNSASPSPPKARPAPTYSNFSAKRVELACSRWADSSCYSHGGNTAACFWRRHCGWSSAASRHGEHVHAPNVAYPFRPPAQAPPSGFNGGRYCIGRGPFDISLPDPGGMSREQALLEVSSTALMLRAIGGGANRFSWMVSPFIENSSRHRHWCSVGTPPSPSSRAVVPLRGFQLMQVVRLTYHSKYLMPVAPETVRQWPWLPGCH